MVSKRITIKRLTRILNGMSQKDLDKISYYSPNSKHPISYYKRKKRNK
jgi:hypothetical protein